MKIEIGANQVRALSMSIGVIAFMSLSFCNQNNQTPSAQDIVKAKLISSNWKMQSVNVDGVDQSVVYKGLTLRFTSTTYSTTNGGIVWPSSGLWNFLNSDGTMIKRDDGLEIMVAVTDTTLKLSLNWPITTLGGGRVISIKGQNVFNFVK